MCPLTCAPHARYRLVVLVLVALLTACAEVQFYQQSIAGHLAVIHRAQPIDDLLQDQKADIQTREKLRLVQNVRRFAAQELALKFNESYTHYVDLERNHVVTNLVAAPEFSTQLHGWCYLVIGCASYRGYFDQHQLAAEVERLEEGGMDVYSYPVLAYSTLGWFSDPVLSSFLALAEPQLARLILHELAHQHLYVKGDTDFNESFATAIATAGLQRFYTGTEGAQVLEKIEQMELAEKEIRKLARDARAQLEHLYALPINDAQKRKRKTEVLARFSEKYQALMETLRPHADEPPATFNNARLGVMGTYDNHVPAFLNLLQHHEGNFALFLHHASRIGSLAASERHLCLRLWGQARSREPAIDEAKTTEPGAPEKQCQ